jgi:flagellar biosynthesis protein FlhA
MVVTQGSTRVAEVAARFTLDAMPGRQMAIDADLNAGLIDENVAKARREEILQEANFYGAMDGSSKFVKGDAVAGIIITVVNLIGGFLIGVFQYDMDMSASASTFTILTIGDGLVSQLPALISATATGIIITRASKEKENFAEGVVTQLVSEYKTLLIVGFVLVIFSLVPGLPTISLAFVGFVFLALGFLIKESKDGFLTFDKIIPKDKKQSEQQDGTQPSLDDPSKPPAAPKKSPAELKKEEESALEEILKMEILELDLGYQLIRLADPNQGGDLLDRIKGMRKKIATDLGFLMPQVRIRDNLHLDANDYEILLKGIEIGKGEIYPEKFLAMDSGLVTDKIDGIETKEPAFGLDAIWVDVEKKEDAIVKGYTTVDPATVISTHMSELVKKYAEELLTRQEVQKLLDSTAKDYPTIVEDCKKVANVGLIQKVLKALLKDGIPIKDLITILETITDIAEITRSTDIIVEQVRSRLARVITGLFKQDDGVLKLLTFNTATEQRLMDHIKEKDGVRDLVLNIGQINSLVQHVSNTAANVLQQGIAPVVIIVDPSLRKSLSDIFEKFSLEVAVLSHAEVDPTATFEVVGTVEVQEI